MTLETVSEHLAFDGVQGVYRHRSVETGCEMQFAVYAPPHRGGERLPVLWYLSGLTCTHANVVEKGEYRQACARLGVLLVAPDTSPRGQGVADSEDYDLGQGAGFYVDATEAPWASHYRMRSYIERELPTLIERHFPADLDRQSIMGHSMGGHGALTIALRNPGTYTSVSALAPIAAPMQAPWGQKAFTHYLGADRSAWRAYDACALLEDGARVGKILVDQGAADGFLDEQLQSDRLRAACERARVPLTLRMRPGYDHSYYFISTFMADHIGWHAASLARR